MKRLVCICISIVLVLSIAACGSSNEGAGTDKSETEKSGTEAKAESFTTSDIPDLKIGVVGKYQLPFYDKIFEGAKAAADVLQISDISYCFPSSSSDAMAQVQQVETLIAEGVDILIISPNQPDTLAAALREAHERGITIISVDTDIKSAYQTSYIGTDNVAAGSEIAERLCKQLEPGSNVVILRGPLGDSNHDRRAAGATETLEEHEVNILEIVDAQSNIEKSCKKMKELIARYEDIDAVICFDENMVRGAVQAIEEEQKENEIIVASFDAEEVAPQMILDGKILFAIRQDTYEMGYKAVMTAVDDRLGKQTDKNIVTGFTVITKENALYKPSK